MTARATDRVVLVGALAGLAASIAVQASLLAGVAVGLRASWAWTLHLGAIAGCWYVAGRIARGGLRGLSGLLRIRRMVPIPLRLALGGLTVNAMIAAGLTAAGRAMPARAWSAYWCMMYLLLTIAAVFVLPRVQAASPAAAN